MTSQVSLLAAFTAGLLSFLSPCILPLVPGYVSFMTGLTTAELKDEGRRAADVLFPALLFVTGFSAIFIAFGATASVLGQFLIGYRDLLQKVAGIVLVAFGVLMLGVIRVPWLYGEARADMEQARKFGPGASFVMGIAFAAGWTPCVGPILGSILALAGASASVSTGVLLLAVYSLGLGVPFVAVALLLGRVGTILRWLTRHSMIINRIAGSLLVVLGVLVFSGKLSLISAWLLRQFPWLGI